MRLLPGRRGRADRSCRQLMPLLQSYLDGATDDLMTARITAHLADCRRCGLEVATYRAIKDALGRQQRPLPTEALDRLHEFTVALAADDLPGEETS